MNKGNGYALASAFKAFGVNVEFVKEVISTQISTYYFNYVNLNEWNKTRLENAITKMKMYYHKQFTFVNSDISHFGLSMPNSVVSPLFLTNLEQPKDSHSIVIGKDLVNRDVVLDFDKIPHLLIAGTTGSGKSILLKTIMYSLYTSIGHKNFELKIIDPKGTEYQDFKNLYNVSYIDETLEAIALVNDMVSEMQYRYREMANGNKEFPHLFIVIDELADLMLTSNYDIENAIVRLAGKARAAKIHLIIATQRPTVNVVTGLIKANMPNRICLQMASQVDSRTMLDHKGAEELLGKGDAIIKLEGKTTETRFQCAMITDSNIRYSFYGEEK